MKKFISLFLSLAMLGLLCACADSGLGINVDNTSTHNSQTTKADTSTTNGSSTGTTKSSGPISENTMPSGSPIHVETGSNGQPVKSNYEGSIGKILKGGKFTMSGNVQMETDGSAQTTPVTFYVSGKKMVIEIKAPLGQLLGGSSNEQQVVRLLNTGSDSYLFMPNVTISELLIKNKNVYYKLTGDDEDIGLLDISDIFNSSNKKYISTTKVTYKGVAYVCEAYKNDSGTTKYYFNSGKLKRIESINNDGSIFIFENIIFSSTVDESVFTLPKDSVDIASLLKLLGGKNS